MTRDDPGARDAMEAAEDLPQLDATALVETAELEAQVKEMYRQVAEEEDARASFRDRSRSRREARIPE